MSRRASVHMQHSCGLSKKKIMHQGCAAPDRLSANSGDRGLETLGDRSPRPDRVWNQIPDLVRDQIIKLALDESTLSPRELAVRFTDTESYFVSEASVYRLLKAHDLIASPAFIIMKAADEFKDKTRLPISFGRPTSPI